VTALVREKAQSPTKEEARALIKARALAKARHPVKAKAAGMEKANRRATDLEKVPAPRQAKDRTLDLKQVPTPRTTKARCRVGNRPQPRPTAHRIRRTKPIVPPRILPRAKLRAKVLGRAGGLRRGRGRAGGLADRAAVREEVAAVGMARPGLGHARSDHGSSVRGSWGRGCRRDRDRGWVRRTTVCPRRADLVAVREAVELAREEEAK
jgi:hypothetical protein